MFQDEEIKTWKLTLIGVNTKMSQMNRIDKVFQEKKDLLSIFYTAGYPNLKDTIRIASQLEIAGADLIEIGLPYSDPIADGPVIQESSTKAIENGMSIELLFDQLQKLRSEVSIPVILMGYLNPVLQFGIENFCRECEKCGIDGLILPDLPMREYQEEYKLIFEKYGLHNVFLVTPQTSEERVRIIDQNTNGFIYMVSSSSITGVKDGIKKHQIEYFERIQKMRLQNKTLIGFGISDHKSFAEACNYSNGAIIGSAFIKALRADASNNAIQEFIKEIKKQNDYTI